MNPNQVNSTIFGMGSAMFTSLAAAIVTTAVRTNELVDKSFSGLVHIASAGDNIANAVEKRSEIYGDAIIRNGELSEQEQTLKYEMRLHNLKEKQRQILSGELKLEPEITVSQRVASAVKDIKDAVAGSEESTGTKPETGPQPIFTHAADAVRA